MVALRNETLERVGVASSFKEEKSESGLSIARIRPPLSLVPIHEPHKPEMLNEKLTPSTLEQVPPELWCEVAELLAALPPHTPLDQLDAFVENFLVGALPALQRSEQTLQGLRKVLRKPVEQQIREVLPKISTNGNGKHGKVPTFFYPNQNGHNHNGHNGNGHNGNGQPKLYVVSKKMEAPSTPEIVVDEVGLKEFFLEPPLYYSPEYSHRLVEWHKEIAKKHHVQNPYFEFTDKDEQPFLDRKKQIGVVDLLVAPIGSLTAEQCAAYVSDQTRIYKDQDTMGGNFPKDDPEACEALIARMIGGASPSEVFINFQVENEHGFRPVAGAKAVFGKGGRTIEAVNQMPDATASLGTLWAMRIKPDVLEKFPKVAETIEQNAVCLSRYYRQSKQTLEGLGLLAKDEEHRKYLQLAGFVLPYLAEACQAFADRNGRNITYALYDTHLTEIVKTMESKYGAQVIAFGEEAAPRKEVSDESDILHYHYHQEKGLGGKLYIVALLVSAYLAGAREQLHANNLPIIEPELA